MPDGSIVILPSDTPSATSQAHLMPCDIQFNGSAPVSVYFKPTETDAAFRGRKLQGMELPLPPGYSGAVLQVGGAWSNLIACAS